MNYQKHYDVLIARAKNRVLYCYSENHHIVPRCLGGTDDKDNLVRLTAEEHYCAHQILTKRHPEHLGLAYAALRMASYVREGRMNNKLYGWLRKRVSKATSIRQKGVPRTEEVKAKVSASHKTSPKAIAAREALFLFRIGHEVSEETRQKLREANALRPPVSEETKMRQSKALKGRVKSPEHLANLSKALKGNKCALGATRSEEVREKIRQAALKRGISPELRAKMAAGSQKLTPEQRSARANKAWETKRAKALALKSLPANTEQ